MKRNLPYFEFERLQECHNPQARVVRKMDSPIQRKNPYPADKYLGNELCYPVDRDLSGG